jgi:proline iminopeptidase
MKPILTQIFISICFLANSHAQRIDSIKYSNGHLYFHHYGEGETVIFLNGGLINHYSQLAEMARETGKFFHVILTEQRGTGKSIPIPFDSTTLNMQTAVDDIKLVLENQKLKQVSILGHSWGAMLAIAFASQYPKMVKSLILVGPGPFQNYDYTDQTYHHNLMSRLGVAELKNFDSLNLRINQGAGTTKDIAQWTRLLRLCFVYPKTRLDSIFHKINVKSYSDAGAFIIKDLHRRPELSQSINKYKGPIDVICGRQDALAFNAYELKVFRPTVILHWIEESGHFPMYEQPKAFYSVLLAILKKTKHE